MQKIPLSQGYWALVDDEDYPLVNQWKWSYDKGYAVRKITLARRRYRLLYLHRFLTNAQPGQMVDHRDGDRSNNTRANLRICTARQNSRNRKTSENHTAQPKVSSYKGVSRLHKTKDRWSALVIADGKRHYLGSFSSQEEAAALTTRKPANFTENSLNSTFPTNRKPSENSHNYLTTCPTLL